MNYKTNKIDTITIGYAKFSGGVPASEKRKLNDWLKARTNSEKIRLVIN